MKTKTILFNLNIQHKFIQFLVIFDLNKLIFSIIVF